MPLPTPSQTVGPFYGYALPFPGGGDLVPAGHPDAVTLHGRVLDGAGDPLPDALLETWQAAPDGGLAGRPGSLRRDPVTGGFAGRRGTDFTGFGRVATDADGHWEIRTLPPPARAPYLAVCLFARGLTHHLFTRAYLGVPAGEVASDEVAAGEVAAGDAVFAAVPADRRDTLLARAVADGRTYRFDIRIQEGPRGEKETVFLDFLAARPAAG
ncbi:protocatechuate 3,4-dioxygenase, alpha subunit [Actinacidiphila alni]|uniref:Protocatechuate 3,4-dioxygenase, alpha subunit n=1 Tax=Actinacidiphila alni TaxID=380248 RepID=A0A1I2IES9_9ACTN|nr:protocatechuate 3,4-dioxygenase subunit alpha [Actinacidiphila alni]SFF40130.1 protocatechuate 3,4-dioxygenase, alpha subunit [Actinacidiphila alni]